MGFMINSNGFLMLILIEIYGSLKYTQPCFINVVLGNASDVWPGELPPGWEL
jgi:hypothetical protein